MKYKLTYIIVLLLVLSSIVYAAEEPVTDECAGILGTLKCFFVGNSANRAGMSWFDRSGNLVGQASATTYNPPVALPSVHTQNSDVQKNQKACDGGNAKSCNNWGYSYQTGQGVPKDLTKAAQLYQQSCEGGNAKGCNNLGYSYDIGQGVPKDLTKAAQLYQQSCDGGYLYGCSNLGTLYYLGKGVEEDKNKAKELFVKACISGNDGSCKFALDEPDSTESAAYLRTKVKTQNPSIQPMNEDYGDLGVENNEQKARLTEGGFKIIPTGNGILTSVQDGKDGNKITRTLKDIGPLGTKVTETKEEKGKVVSTTAKFIDKNNKLVYTQTTTKDKDGKDVTTITGANDIAFDSTSDWNPTTGSCNKGTACLKAKSGEFAGRAHFQASENPYDPYPFTVVQEPTKTNNIKRTLSYEKKNADGEMEEVNVQQECVGDCNTLGNVKKDKKEIGYKLLTADYTESEFDSEKKTRVYYEKSQGFFGQIESGVTVGCKDVSCKNSKSYFFSSDNDYVCEKQPCSKTNGKDVDTIVASNSCNNDCIKAIQETNSKRSTGLFFAGQQEWQQVGGQILNGFSGWSGISNALFGDIYANKLANDIDRWFAGSVISEDYWESSVCYETPTDNQGDGFAFIERPGGLTGTDFVAVAAIQAEMFEEKTPLLCMHNLDPEAEKEFVCPGKLYCNPDDSFCYDKEGDDTPVKAFFYKISWGVTAPSDLGFTPYGDESSAVEFNLYLGNTKLNDKTIKLQNGETDNNMITHYSDKDYENIPVCIKWIKPPYTLSRSMGGINPVLGGIAGAGSSVASPVVVFAEGDNTVPIKDVCYTIKKAEIGTVIFTSDTDTETVSVNNGAVKISNEW